MQKNLIYAFSALFFFLTMSLFIMAQPQAREKRVYTLLKPYIPYSIEKKVTGLYIKNHQDDSKIEPKNSEVYTLLDTLEKEWGMKHLRLIDDTLEVRDDAKQIKATIILNSPKERAYVHDFFGL